MLTVERLDSITVKGYRSIASIENLKLGKVNVLIGANGSGKSNFIKIFGFLHAIRAGLLQGSVARSGGADVLLHFGPKNTNMIEVEISFEGGINQYKISLERNDLGELIPKSESVAFWDRNKYSRPFTHDLNVRGKEAGISGTPGSEPKLPRIAASVVRHLSSWTLYHFHDTSRTSPFKTNCDLNDNSRFRADGSNMAAFLYRLRKTNESSYGLIRSTVQKVAPFFEDFILNPDPLNPTTLRLAWKHKGSEAYFDAASLSDGTLRFIALATLFLQPRELRPSVILVDEPELGLHPYAITMLGSLIKQSSVHSQVIVATQSPLLLDQFAPEDVLVAERVNGSTQLTRLEPTKYASWLEDYSLGRRRPNRGRLRQRSPCLAPVFPRI
jgi:predicted ATPase